MKSILKQLKNPSVLFGFALLILLPGLASADPTNGPVALCSSTTSCTFKNLFENVGFSVNNGMKILYLVSALSGLGVVTSGLMFLKQHAHDAQGSSGNIKKAVYALIAGGALVAVPVITMVASNSIVGDQGVRILPESSVLHQSGPQTLPPIHVKPSINNNNQGK